MAAVFQTVLRMSVSAAAVIVVILLLRLPLRLAPKKWRYLLWGAAGFRLCCPVSFRAAFSLFRLRPSLVSAVSGAGESLPAVRGAVSAVSAPVSAEALAAAADPASAPSAILGQGAETVSLWPTLGVILWLAGMAVMLSLGVVRYLRMRRRLSDAVALERGVYATDRISVPFLMGLFPPRIYVPAGLSGEEMTCVLAHERTHLCRGDHWVKLAGYVLLAVHWFNPLVWTAFLLMSRDMEMSCDERVLRDLQGSAKAYSRTLLRFAEGRRFPAPAPLGFGESDAKSRIRNALRWKKPKLWVTLAAVVLCAAAAAACTADPKEPESPGALEAGDTLRFAWEDGKILLQSSEGQESCGEVLRRLSLPGFTYEEADDLYRLEDPVFPGEYLRIGMDRDAVRAALYAVPPQETDGSALSEPGVRMKNEEGSYYRISGIFAGEPFRMTLQYAKEKYLQGVTLFFYPPQDQAGAVQLYEKVKEALTAQLGKPEDDTASPYAAANAGWGYEGGALILQLQQNKDGNRVLLFLSGVTAAEVPDRGSIPLQAEEIREAALGSGAARTELLLTAEQTEELKDLLAAAPEEAYAGGRGIPSQKVLKLNGIGCALRFAAGVIELDGVEPPAEAPVWEIRDEKLYAWLDALWTESPFGQGDDPLGLIMEVKDASAAGCTLELSQAGGIVTGELQTGAAFFLEGRDEKGVWRSLPTNMEAVWHLLAYGIPSGGKTELGAKWDVLYGKLQPGHYRIGKEVLENRGNGDRNTWRVYAEFDIPG